MKKLKRLIFSVLVLGICVLVNPNTVFAETCNITDKDSLSDAISQANGETVQLCQAIDLDGFVTINNNVTIDLNGYTISRDGNTTGTTMFNITSGTVVFEDSKGNGAINFTNPAANSQAIQVHGGNVTLKSGKFTNAGGAVISVDTSATLTIEGTAELVGADSSTLKFTVQVFDNSKLIVDGNAKISGASYGIIASGETPSVTIKGGEVNGSYAGISSAEDTNSFDLTVSGGKITGGYGIALIGTEPTLNMTGGTVEAEGIAILGNGSGTSESTITIDGGNVISKTNAAIYQPQTGTLTIKKGNITGKIGIVARQGDVIINGGNITATGTDGENIRVGDSKDASGFVQLPTGVAVVVDNTNAGGYADNASVIVTDGIVNGDVESLLSYGQTTSHEKEFNISGGKFNHEVETKYLSSIEYGQSQNGVVGKLHNISYSDPDNGTVNVPTNAAEGETVTVDCIPDEGFVIDTIVVTKADGTKIDVVGDQFVMPTDDVIVTVTFKETPEVPSTGDNVMTYAVIGTVALVSVLGTAIYFKKVNE